jgi:16S rRNA (uracil1498-N3)-methyltransferase
MPPVLRRLHVPRLMPGQNELDPDQAHHARNVLRLEEGQTVEVFDDHGSIALATLHWHDPPGAVVRVAQIDRALESRVRWTVASAVPKGERADWMVEKLSELGTHAFIPLATARGVVLPEGKNKHERWVRIATESAKQSRRRGVMRIDPLTPVLQLLSAPPAGRMLWLLSPSPEAAPIAAAARDNLSRATEVILCVGPEGGWTDAEAAAFAAAGAKSVRLTDTILRVETAAVAAAAILATERP